MKDIIAWFGFKRMPFDKNIKPKDVLDTDSFKESKARLDYIKRRRGILLLTGDPGVGKTLTLRRYVDGLNENLFKPATLRFPRSAEPISSLTSTGSWVCPHACPKARSTARSSRPSSSPKSNRERPSCSSSMKPTCFRPDPWRN